MASNDSLGSTPTYGSIRALLLRQETEISGRGGSAARLGPSNVLQPAGFTESMMDRSTPPCAPRSLLGHSLSQAPETAQASGGTPVLLSQLSNVKTPEFPILSHAQRSQTSSKGILDMDSFGAEVKRNLYSSLSIRSVTTHTAPGQPCQQTSNSAVGPSSLRRPNIPPILRRLHQDPSLKEVRFVGYASSSSDNDDDGDNTNDDDGDDGSSGVEPCNRSEEEVLHHLSEVNYEDGSCPEGTPDLEDTTSYSDHKRNTSCRSSQRDTRHGYVAHKRSAHMPSPVERPSQERGKGLQVLQTSKTREKEEAIKVNGKYYHIFDMIGSGGSSKVYIVYDDNKATFAVKLVSLADTEPEVTKMFLNEVTILKQLKDCKRVVTLYDYEYCRKKKLLSLVMEKGDSDLSAVLRHVMRTNSLSAITVKFYWSEMLHAVQEIHEKGIIHSDLKPANFLFVKGKLKLIDFGIAETMQADVTSIVKQSQMGTLNFMSPESIMGTGEVSRSTGRPDIKINTKSDVWALGCILYTLAYGKPPFHDFTTVHAKLHAITSKNHQIPFPATEDRHLRDVLKQCLQRDPKKRPTIAELLEHPYLGQGMTSSASLKPSVASLVTEIENMSPESVQRVANFVKILKKK